MTNNNTGIRVKENKGRACFSPSLIITIFRLSLTFAYLCLVKARSLIGYVLPEYVDGDDADPTRIDCVDKYITDALAKHHAYTAKLNSVQSRALSASSLPATTITYL